MKKYKIKPPAYITTKEGKKQLLLQIDLTLEEYRFVKQHLISSQEKTTIKVSEDVSESIAVLPDSHERIKIGKGET